MIYVDAIISLAVGLMAQALAKGGLKSGRYWRAALLYLCAATTYVIFVLNIALLVLATVAKH